MAKLGFAIAMAETGNCRLGYGKSHNNCHGILKKRKPIQYANKQEAYSAFYSLWKRKYKTYPTKELAKKWTGNENAEQWLANVDYWYNKAM